MIGIILAGGFAKRMEPLTYSKPLLPIGDKPCIEHICNKLVNIDSLEKIYITTNNKFEIEYREWIEYSGLDKRFELIIEPSNNEREKIGALAAIALIIKKNITKELFISVGDNYFDYPLKKLFDSYYEDKLFTTSLYNIKNLELVKNYSSCVLDGNFIIDFKEKPKNPISALISTVNYICPPHQLQHIKNAVSTGLKDNPGKLIEYLINKRVPLKGIIFEGTWFDIGDLNSYINSNINYLNGEKFISKEAKVDLSSHIGRNVVLSKDCIIKDSIIENSVILKGSRILNSKITNSIIGRNSIVEFGSINNAIYEKS